jgi:hypothetical protein
MVDNSEQKKTNNEEKETEEAHAYTPGLKVKRIETVRKMRRLPILGEVFPKVGDQVKHNNIVARTEISGDPEIVKVAMRLGLEPEDIPKFMKKGKAIK